MKNLLLSSLFIAISGCSSITVQPQMDPDKFLFAPIRDKIDSLEHSPKAEWSAAAGEQHRIESHEQLEALTRDLDYSQDERAGIRNDFDRADSVVHYGFEANYHALVFFDSRGQPFRVEKW